MGGQLDGNFLPGSLPHKFILIVILIICFAVNKSEFSVCVFFLISIRFLTFFCHCSVCLSVCLVLYASLPENKIDDDDDDQWLNYSARGGGSLQA